MCLDNDFIISKGFSKYHKLLLYFRTHVNIVEQLKEYNVFLNGEILLVDIEEINVLHNEQKNKIDVELKVRGIDSDVKSVLGSVYIFLYCY